MTRQPVAAGQIWLDRRERGRTIAIEGIDGRRALVKLITPAAEPSRTEQPGDLSWVRIGLRGLRGYRLVSTDGGK